MTDLASNDDTNVYTIPSGDSELRQRNDSQPRWFHPALIFVISGVLVILGYVGNHVRRSQHQVVTHNLKQLESREVLTKRMNNELPHLPVAALDTVKAQAEVDAFLRQQTVVVAGVDVETKQVSIKADAVEAQIGSILLPQTDSNTKTIASNDQLIASIAYADDRIIQSAGQSIIQRLQQAKAKGLDPSDRADLVAALISRLSSLKQSAHDRLFVQSLKLIAEPADAPAIMQMIDRNRERSDLARHEPFASTIARLTEGDGWTDVLANQELISDRDFLIAWKERFDNDKRNEIVARSLFRQPKCRAWLDESGQLGFDRDEVLIRASELALFNKCPTHRELSQMDSVWSCEVDDANRARMGRLATEYLRWASSISPRAGEVIDQCCDDSVVKQLELRGFSLGDFPNLSGSDDAPINYETVQAAQAGDETAIQKMVKAGERGQAAALEHWNTQAFRGMDELIEKLNIPKVAKIEQLLSEIGNLSTRSRSRALARLLAVGPTEDTRHKGASLLFATGLESNRLDLQRAKLMQNWMVDDHAKFLLKLTEHSDSRIRIWAFGEYTNLQPKDDAWKLNYTRMIASKKHRVSIERSFEDHDLPVEAEKLLLDLMVRSEFSTATRVIASTLAKHGGPLTERTFQQVDPSSSVIPAYIVQQALKTLKGRR